MVDTTWFACSGIIAVPVSEGRAHLPAPEAEELTTQDTGTAGGSTRDRSHRFCDAKVTQLLGAQGSPDQTAQGR